MRVEGGVQRLGFHDLIQVNHAGMPGIKCFNFCSKHSSLLCNAKVTQATHTRMSTVVCPPNTIYKNQATSKPLL